MNVRLTSAAHADLSDALRWYRQHQAGPDRRFLEAVDSANETVSSHPEIGPTVDGEVRRLLLRGFPYVLFYAARENEVVVVGVFHGARDPKSWPASDAT